MSDVIYQVCSSLETGMMMSIIRDDSCWYVYYLLYCFTSCWHVSYSSPSTVALHTLPVSPVQRIYFGRSWWPLEFCPLSSTPLDAPERRSWRRWSACAERHRGMCTSPWQPGGEEQGCTLLLSIYNDCSCWHVNMWSQFANPNCCLLHWCALQCDLKKTDAQMNEKTVWVING